MDITVSRAFPIANGIVTVENMAQAEDRCLTNRMDKGGDAAEAMLQLYALKKRGAL